MYLEIKQGWLRPCDYFDFDSLRYGVNRMFTNIGLSLNLNFKPFIDVLRDLCTNQRPSLDTNFKLN